LAPAAVVGDWLPSGQPEMLAGKIPMTASEGRLCTPFDELKPGDRIEVEHYVAVGRESRRTRTNGTVVRTERRRHGSHPLPHGNEGCPRNAILLELADGELTTVDVDESTVLRRA